MEGLFFEGFFLQASLIFALGAQNIFVLESGLKKQHPFTVCIACFFCDLLLIMLGVAGAGTIFAAFSQLKIIIGVIGIFFLVRYGLSKIFSPTEVFSEEENGFIKRDLRKSLLLALTFSLLNPHAYLDAFILIGGYSTKYSFLSDRLFVGLGASIFSLVWFLFLSNASRIMKPIFSNAKSLRLVTTCSGIVLLLISIQLSFDVYSWINVDTHSQILVKSISYPAPAGLLYSAILL